MASTPCQSDPTIGFEPDPVHGFAYCRELPPDVPPGMTLDQWRLAHHCARRDHRHPHLHLPRVRPGVHCGGAGPRVRHRRRDTTRQR